MTALGNIVLASASEVRAQVLKNAGLEFEIDPADVDEGRIKEELVTEKASPRDVALTLAKAKAVTVSQRQPNAWVIGADQVLVSDNMIFDKPANPREAASHLCRFRGRSHDLISAVCVARENEPEWHHTESVTLHVRDFSDRFLDSYLSSAGDSVLASVGAYRLEEMGAQLFTHIDGDYFAVLGLPLLPLLTFLRGQGAIET